MNTQLINLSLADAQTVVEQASVKVNLKLNQTINVQQDRSKTNIS